MAVTGILVAAAPAATAADRTVLLPPEHLVGSSVLAQCDGFDVIDEFDVVFQLRLFFDKAGQFVRFVEHVQGTDTLVNSVTGKRFVAPFHNSTVLDQRTGEVANHGVFYKLTVPGAGAVFLDVGNVILNFDNQVVFQAGPHQAINGDFGSLCQALG